MEAAHGKLSSFVRVHLPTASWGIEKLFFSPDSSRLYAFAADSVYTRSNLSGTSHTWINITPPGVTGNCRWLGLQFLPSNQNTFFISNRVGADASYQGIYKSTVPVPTSSDWSKITAGFAGYLGPTLVSDWKFMAISLPDDDTLFFFGYKNEGGALFKYSIASGTIYPLNNNLPNTGSDRVGDKGILAVSPAATTNNADRRNIYFGWDVPYQSTDGGYSFWRIGKYSGKTHGDVRDIFIQHSTNTLRGIGDRVFIATDGGVSKKPAGIDLSIHGDTSTVDVSGKGLNCGTLWGFSVSEKDGIGLGGAMHCGTLTYEPNQTPQWRCPLGGSDAWTSAIDKGNPQLGFSWHYSYLLYETAPGPSYIFDSVKLMSAQPGTDYDFNDVGVGPPTETNIYSDVFCVKNSFWRKSTLSSSFTNMQASWGFPSSGGILGAFMAFNPYVNDYDGYVVYNPRESQQIYFHGVGSGTTILPVPAVPGTPNHFINSIATNSLNTQQVWVGQGGIEDRNLSVAKNRVHFSPDRGTHWIDISSGLPPGVPARKILFDDLTNKLYVGTDVGIYRWNFNDYNALATFTGTDGQLYNYSVPWTCFSQGKVAGHDFPNGQITDLDINRCQGKLYAAVFGRSIWSTELNDSETLHATTLITSNTTWTSPQLLYGSVQIKPGYTLTISNCTFYMPSGSAIIVEPGAKLVVDHATITNECGRMWKGIEAWGDFYSSQTATAQGWVLIKNGSVIEHAKVGVCNYQPGISIDNNGGVIQVTGSTFLNNEKAAVFESYLNSSTGASAPDLSYFMNTSFVVDNNYKGTITPANAQVVMTGTDGIRFNGCTFLNRKYSSSDGIRATNSGFQLGAYCTTPITTYATPCASLQRSVFRGFKNGILVKHLTPSIDPTVTIDQADFDSVTVGVNINAYSNVSTTHCSFRVGRGYTLPEKVVDVPYACGSNIGILAQNCYQFTIEDNAFVGQTNSFSISPWYNHGTIVSNTYSTPNKVYRNTYDSLDYAVLSSGDNHTNHYPAPPGNGLRVLCNAFAHNGTDIFIGGNLAGNGIADDQGDGMFSAGNTFNSSTTNIVNDNPYHTLRYFYNPYVGSEYPATVSSTSYVLRIGAYLSNSCPVSIPDKEDIRRTTAFGKAINTTGLNDHKRNFFGAKAVYTDSLAAYNSLLDYGNTDSIISMVRGAGGYAGIEATLSACSPNLSGRVLMEVAMKYGDDPSKREDLEELFSANPDALGSSGVLAYVEEICHFSPNDMDSLITAATEDTTLRRTKLQRSITQAEEAMHHAANVILMALKSPIDNSVSVSDSAGAGICFDSTSIYFLCDSNVNYSGFDSVDVWLQNIGGLWTEYARANTQRYFHNNTAANTLFEAIGSHLLSADDSAMYATYDSLWTVMVAAEADNRSTYNLNEEEVAMLDTTIDGNFSYNAARVIISGIRVNPTAFPCTVPLRIPREHKGGAGTTAEGTPGVIRSTANVSVGDRFTVYPNPTSGVVTFTYNVPQANNDLSIVVVNVMGEKVMEKLVPGNIGKEFWDPAGLPPGVYMYKASCHKGIVKQGKIVVVK